MDSVRQLGKLKGFVSVVFARYLEAFPFPKGAGGREMIRSELSAAVCELSGTSFHRYGISRWLGNGGALLEDRAWWMGKGDRRTKHGKLCNKSFGKARPRKRKEINPYRLEPERPIHLPSKNQRNPLIPPVAAEVL